MNGGKQGEIPLLSATYGTLFARQSWKAYDLNACEQGIFARPMHLDDREDEYSQSSRVLRSRFAVGERSPTRIVIFSHDPARS